jgi:hypothetical protein
LLQRIMKRVQGATSGTAKGLPGEAEGLRSEPGLLGRLREALPQALQAHLLDVMEKPGEVVLFVDTATWAGRIRFALPELEPLAAGRRLTVRLSQVPRTRPTP